jgi:hypothetical protein
MELSTMPSNDRGTNDLLVDFLLALCRSPELGTHISIYHRLFYLAKQHCCSCGRIQDMREICRAGLGVYGPDLALHEARRHIFYTLGECCEAELDFESATEVSGRHKSHWPSASIIVSRVDGECILAGLSGCHRRQCPLIAILP